MDNFRNMFSLGGGGRANEITQGGRTDGTNSPTRVRRSSFGSEDQWDDTGVPFRDDTSAPSVSARLRAQGDQTMGEIVVNNNVFALGGGGGRQTNYTPRAGVSASAPPKEILQWPTPNEGGAAIQNDPPNIRGTNPSTNATGYSGMATATQ